MSERNVTMVAFYGNDKQDDLKELLLEVRNFLPAKLPDKTPLSFDHYEVEQMHGTLIGMEVVKTAEGRLVGRWLKENKKVSREIDIKRLHEILEDSVPQDKPLFTHRFGGFPEAYCRCKEECPEALSQWQCRSAIESANAFHSCDRTPYEGSFYVIPSGPVMITGWPVNARDNPEGFPHSLYQFRQSLEACGLGDAYHYHQGHGRGHWRDDDGYIRVSTLKSKLFEKQLDDLKKIVRDHLSSKEPLLIPVTAKDLSFVLYDHPSLSREHVFGIVTLEQFLENPSTLEGLFKEVRKSRSS